MAGVVTSGSFGECTFLVTPDKMHKTSEQVLTKINSLRWRLNSISSTVNNTTSYWDGDASDARRKACKRKEKETAEIFARLMEHVNELKIMAEEYVKTEATVANIAQSLPTDVIF